MTTSVSNPAVSGKRSIASRLRGSEEAPERGPALVPREPERSFVAGWYLDERWSSLLGRRVWRNLSSGETAVGGTMEGEGKSFGEGGPSPLSFSSP